MKTLRLTLIIILGSGFLSFVAAQDTLTLMQCHELTVENAPRLKDKENLKMIADLKNRNAGSNWFPGMNLNGKASYQSDVVTVALTDPTIPVEFPAVPKDQYSINLDVNQTIYDGGITRHQKAYESASSAAQIQKVDVDLYSLKEQVNNIYFSILILQENMKNMEIMSDNLKEREKLLKSGIENGIVLESELKVLQVEIIKVKQSMLEIDSNRKAMLEMLKIYTGKELSGEVILNLPDFGQPDSSDVKRPEYRWFDLQSETLEAGKALSRSKRMPVLYAFGQAGYGKPGYNMLNENWDSYYMVGAGLKWNIWDWSRSRREREILEYQQSSLLNQRDVFDRSVRIQLARETARMDQYNGSIELDNMMLVLQKDIVREAASKLENGTMTASDYIIELNRENAARIRVASDSILLAQAVANYMTICGTL